MHDVSSMCACVWNTVILDKANAPVELSAEEKMKQIMDEGLQEEAAKRKKRLRAAAKRRAKREKAWLYAHQHMYVKIPGQVPYCVVCRERSLQVSNLNL